MTKNSDFYDVKHFVTAPNDTNNTCDHQKWLQKVPLHCVAQFQFVIVVGGGPNSGISKPAFLSGAVVLLIDHLHGYREWFEQFMRPFVHYVPIQADLSNSHCWVKFLFNNREQASWIAQNGLHAAHTLFDDTFLVSYAYRFMLSCSTAQTAPLEPMPSNFNLLYSL